MFKRIILCGLLAIMPVWLMAGNPANNSITITPVVDAVITAATDTMTIDSQWTSTWKFVDSVIVVKTDTCYTTYVFSARVTLQPGQRLWYGLVDGGTATAVAETLICELPVRSREAKSFSIAAVYQDSLISTTDANDTIKVYAAVQGSTSQERVKLTHIRLTSVVTNKD